MGITTKKGDKGYTSLYDGSRVSKYHPRVQTCGTLDELSSFLGLAKSLLKNKKTKAIIESIQKDLFIIGAEIAIRVKYVNKVKKRIGPNDTTRIERHIDELEKRKKFEGCCFYLPGENVTSAVLDVARTAARRAERYAVRLKSKGVLKNRYIQVYLNRVSDLLYLFSRDLEKKPRKLS